jgi:soluble lytic murein transglycosylase
MISSGLLITFCRSCVVLALLVGIERSGASAELEVSDQLGGRDVAKDMNPSQSVSFGIEPLHNFDFPNESQLLEELGIEDVPAYRESARVADLWIRSGLRSGDRDELVRVCSSVMNPHDTHFPMTAFNLRCVPWWLSQRSLRMPADAAGGVQSKNRLGFANRGRLATLRDWQELSVSRMADFVNLFRPRDLANLERHLGFALDPSVGCDKVYAFAGLLNRAEEFLPEISVWTQMRLLYSRYVTCISDPSQSLESTHLRMGLTAVFFGEPGLAERALTAALAAPEQEERQRTLFWLGLLNRGENRTSEVISNFQNPFWKELRDEFPLSIHSVIASHVQGEDPYSLLVGDVLQPVRRRDGYQWSDYNLVALMFEVLVARGAAQGLSNWSHAVARFWPENANDKRLFLGIAHARAKNYLASIRSLTAYLHSSETDTYHVKFLKLLFPTPYQDKILKYAEGMDPLVVYGLIRQESAFNPSARSVANARGLMQLLPSTAQTLAQVSSGDLFDPSKNVQLGSAYLRQLLLRNDNHLERVLAAYNAGQSNILRWIKRFPGANDLLFADLIPFKETRSYVSLIQRNTYWYGRLWADQSGHYEPDLIARVQQSNTRSRTVDSLLRLSAKGTDHQDATLGLLPQIPDFRHFTEASATP